MSHRLRCARLQCGQLRLQRILRLEPLAHHLVVPLVVLLYDLVRGKGRSRQEPAITARLRVSARARV